MGLEGERLEEVSWQEIREYLRDQLTENKKIIKEVENKIKQSEEEIEKLAKKNALVSTNLQKLQSQPNSFSQEETKKVYDLALEMQKRLFIMRGQKDKLESEKRSLSKNNELINKMLKVNAAGYTQVDQMGYGFADINDIEMIIQAQETERQRLSRLMHDIPAQALSNFILQTDIALRLLNDNPIKAQEELESLKVAAATAFERVRNFVFELRPMMLDDLGIIPTLKRYIETLQEQYDVEIRMANYGGERRYKPYLEAMVFRAIQGLLENSIKHGAATMVNLQIDVSEDVIKVNVDDNGKGFEIGLLEELKSNSLNILKERIRMIGGDFEINSIVGQGTRVRLVIPVSS